MAVADGFRCRIKRWVNGDFLPESGRFRWNRPTRRVSEALQRVLENASRIGPGGLVTDPSVRSCDNSKIGRLIRHSGLRSVMPGAPSCGRSNVVNKFSDTIQSDVGRTNPAPFDSPLIAALLGGYNHALDVNFP